MTNPKALEPDKQSISQNLEISLKDINKTKLKPLMTEFLF